MIFGFYEFASPYTAAHDLCCHDSTTGWTDEARTTVLWMAHQKENRSAFDQSEQPSVLWMAYQRENRSYFDQLESVLWMARKRENRSEFDQ